ncbi:MAG: 5-bromo-4-chloroindolyl phosphate hydrolysis family protein [Kurthia sp.]|nr:5-bromo-4-chloroindolyl phosphate hydrolysis family protein [Candidatus Kurthia equi]
MLHAGHTILRYFIAFLTVPITIVITVGFLNIDVFISLVIAALVFILSLFITNSYQRYKKRKQFNLSKSEYNHIEAQLKEAIEFLHQFNRTYTKIRSISGFKKLYEMSKLSKRIISIVRTNPPKFYQAEIFFYSHLPSAAEITEKFAYLSKQPIKDTEIHIALQRTRDTLEDLFHSMEKDLRQVLAADIEGLKVELDFVKKNARRSSNAKEEL